MPPGIAPTARGNSLIAPLGEMRPILFPASSVNQRLPSGPAVMAMGALLAVGTANSTMGGGASGPADAAPADPKAMTLARIGPRRDWDDLWTIFDPSAGLPGPLSDWAPQRLLDLPGERHAQSCRRQGASVTSCATISAIRFRRPRCSSRCTIDS